MDLTKLFEMQKTLDARIEREHPREDGEDRLAKKLLALQVELANWLMNGEGLSFGVRISSLEQKLLHKL